MTTQVATSHTIHTRAPLKVPRRPPMNHVANAIQKFLPIAVVFLMAMVAYSYIRPAKTVYPPYYPPNVGMQSNRYEELGEFAKNTINKRAEMFDTLKRNSGLSPESSAAEWKMWSNNKANELKQKLESAKSQGENVMETASEVVSKLQKKSGVTAKDTDAMDHTIDAADWWKEYGEKLVDDAKEFSSAAQDFAYDAVYAWKQKAADMKEAAKDKLEDLKDASGEALDAGKEKAEHTIEDLKEKGEDTVQNAKDTLQSAKDTAAEVLSSASDKVHKTLDKSVEELSKRLEGLKEGILRAGFDTDNTKKSPLSNLKLVPQRLDNNTMASKLSSFIERVKEGLIHDEEVRHALSMKAEWENVDFEHKVNSIVQQVCLLGDDVVAEVLNRLESEHALGTCYHQPVCPA